ncbi:unnamed protein product [Rhizoctonia solani]|uniref:CHAT domain-containing protein n=1 Tax=Rhizoctonia solani TaxID=456999 RepID=A0A8H3DT66_9AGAM|nr:unnamed protein product [Rhizoctonia solani]
MLRQAIEQNVSPGQSYSDGGPSSIRSPGLDRIDNIEDCKNLFELGIMCDDQFQRSGELKDLEDAINYISQAIDQVPDGYLELPKWLSSLAMSRNDRFRHLGELQDLEKALKCRSRALNLTPEGHPDFPHRLANLGASHRDRFIRLGELGDLEKAIECGTRALALTPDGHLDLPQRLASLVLSYNHRFRRLGELEDLEKAIEYLTCALKSTSDDHPALPGRLANLGVFYNDRFKRLGELGDLEKGIEHLSRALRLTPDGHPNLPYRLANLGALHLDRFRRLDKLEDLEKGIKQLSCALQSTPDNHPALPTWLTNLVVSYNDRFERLGILEDLEKAIECGSRGIALTPDGHPDLPTQLTNIGGPYHSRFRRLGDLEDLEKAIEFESRALALTPDDHPSFSTRLANLVVSHNERFENLGEMEDLEKAIEYGSCALALTPDDHPSLPARLSYLGESHSNRFERMGEPEDLKKAMEYIFRALDLTPKNHPDLSHRLGNIGVSHRDQFRVLGELEHLDKAIEYLTRAVALTADDHPDLPAQLTNLGGSYIDRFRRLNELEDLEKGVECQSRALAFTPEGHPGLPDRHYSLALSRILQYNVTNKPSHLDDALTFFRSATQSSAGAPRVKFGHALYWATLAFQHSTLNCIEAYQTTIDILPQFIWLGATTNQRYEDLEQIKHLAGQAASTALLASKYELALEWLEHTRCVVWNQSLMLRSPLDVLQASHSTLASQLQTIASQLHQAGSESRASRALSSNITPEQAARQHRHLAKKYNELLSEARKLSGFEGFLLPMKSRGLVRAAQGRHIVVINCHPDRCDGIIISPGQDTVQHIPLPGFSHKKALDARSNIQKSLQRDGIRQRGAHLDHEPEQEEFLESTLKILWDDIVKPVLEFTGYLHNTPTSNPDLPHITWCPTGALSFLPLHAAGNYDQPHSRVLNYAISSYTPTLTALLSESSSPNLLTNGTHILAVSQEATSLPGYKLSKLPGTSKELACIKSHAQQIGNIDFSALAGDKATTTAVLAAMETHDWVHLACHAHQNVGDATKSGFFLHDGILDLASINRRSFKGKGLAFLSACQTATGAESLPDEAVHLASGMLMAGYTSVIATMWSVNDEDAPFVADKVYGELMRGGKIGNGKAGKALHNAVTELRGKIGEKEFGRWVPYIHIGS